MPRDEWKRANERTRHHPNAFADQVERESKPDAAARWLASRGASEGASKPAKARRRRRGRKKNRKASNPEITPLAEIAHMHADIKALFLSGDREYDGEAYLLLCSLGGILGQYPRVKPATLRRAIQRYRDLTIL